MEPKYKRILIKLSGEALAGDKGVGIDLATVQAIAKEVAEVHDSGVKGVQIYSTYYDKFGSWYGSRTGRLHWNVRNSHECPCYG